jgi:hypothetical protein
MLDFRGRLLIMPSNGGVMASGIAKEAPTATLESGPVGGFVATARWLSTWRHDGNGEPAIRTVPRPSSLAISSWHRGYNLDVWLLRRHAGPSGFSRAFLLLRCQG